VTRSRPAVRNALLAFALCGAWVAAGNAERKPLDGIVAVVNDDVILASELGEEVSVRLYQLGSAAQVKDIRAYTGEVLESMIDARLLLQAADEENIVVSKEDIQPYLDEELERIRSAFSSEAEYEAALAEYGMSEKDLVIRYRKNLRDQLKIRRFTDQVLAPRVRVTEEEIRAYYESHRAEIALPELVTVREIAIAKQPSKASQALVRRKLEELRAAALAGGDFKALAEKLAEAEGGESGGSFKYRPGEAVPALERAAAGLRPGEISPVSAGPDGYWLVRLVGVENDKREVQYVHLTLEVTPEDVAAARARAEAAAAALARGVPFAEVAAQYSDNEESSAAGGLVGELSVPEIEAEMPEIAAALRELSPGEVTSVVERPEGFFIIRLDERKEGEELSYEAARERIKRLLTTQKLALEQKKYLQELKSKAYIKTFD
jgi:peptidyl-prolyl cis-trans isomerase SurA